MIKDAISKIIKNQDLTESEMISVVNEIMSGEASPAQIGAFLTALRIKGETVDEITGAAKVMREKSTKINAKGKKVVDTCGTGGDEAMTFNISTAAAFVAAGAGLTIAKHGNRSVSSKCGSADVLAALGVNIEVEVAKVEECLKEIGIGFLFAPMLHGAMKYAAPVRREIGIRTIFNILGPLTNPAGARCQVIGVYDDSLTDSIGKVLSNLGAEHAFVVHGEDGLDEITLAAQFERCLPSDLKGFSPSEHAEFILDIFKGKRSPKRDVVILNSAFAIVAGGVAKSIEEGIAAARGSIDSGLALEKLNKLKEMTNK
ncbi:MAG: anthranilate phosphoribosyltransferase [Deltaproteobacteria bacterium]|nr:anthranilate phosphoribosyltransferase [Deltaproteobacteria bacterium]